MILILRYSLVKLLPLLQDYSLDKSSGGGAMVFLDATLHGEGRQRACRVKATRKSEFADETAVPTSIAYCRCDVDDSDDFPDGDYELEFDGHFQPLFEVQSLQHCRNTLRRAVMRAGGPFSARTTASG